MSNLKSNQQEEEDEPEYLQYKVVLIGDGTVGKTSICTRFCQDHYGKEYKQTIGLDFFLKRIQFPGDVNILLQIWDIGGQTIGSKMIGTYLFGADAICLVYDISNHDSFLNLADWHGLVKKSFLGVDQ